MVLVKVTRAVGSSYFERAAVLCALLLLVGAHPLGGCVPSNETAAPSAVLESVTELRRVKFSLDSYSRELGSWDKLNGFEFEFSESDAVWAFIVALSESQTGALDRSNLRQTGEWKWPPNADMELQELATDRAGFLASDRAAAYRNTLPVVDASNESIFLSDLSFHLVPIIRDQKNYGYGNYTRLETCTELNDIRYANLAEIRLASMTLPHLLVAQWEVVDEVRQTVSAFEADFIVEVAKLSGTIPRYLVDWVLGIGTTVPGGWGLCYRLIEKCAKHSKASNALASMFAQHAFSSHYYPWWKFPYRAYIPELSEGAFMTAFFSDLVAEELYSDSELLKLWETTFERTIVYDVLSTDSVGFDFQEMTFGAESTDKLLRVGESLLTWDRAAYRERVSERAPNWHSFNINLAHGSKGSSVALSEICDVIDIENPLWPSSRERELPTD
ncbi:MAG: hypothetical protein KDB07_01300 [Planctomycetes bacterium]|nr:hypothetical protein [Planctomycetota bacterium]